MRPYTHLPLILSLYTETFGQPIPNEDGPQMQMPGFLRHFVSMSICYVRRLRDYSDRSQLAVIGAQFFFRPIIRVNVSSTPVYGKFVSCSSPSRSRPSVHTFVVSPPSK
ncbi:uncharacterized protein BT62DRAFT_336481 [Guyanagaster necrorhizus]|uniref:Uncharacterized protein n=1 Tax=Guyanagaster necrorhizus TaxID=856835 RepID=A0A9P8APD5_9AGAR|nr:uncharacterized protein BT62DRAFT_336481 [Guyanagaster necrorhizus MCA 3950]KAG7443223.1 hypothetical protein BT62DRAFT_336481 [Guyanagaster necrorhizus MCA 3950]